MLQNECKQKAMNMLIAIRYVLFFICMLETKFKLALFCTHFMIIYRVYYLIKYLICKLLL